jgi:putative inorganic carbon (hco3(-)) transporter
MRDALLLLVWVALLLYAFRQPFIGVMIWIWVALLSPTYFVYGFMYDAQLNKSIAIVTALAFLFSAGKKKIHWDANLILLMLLLLQGTISYLLAQNNIGAPEVFDKFWKACVLCVLINMTVMTRLRLHSVVLISAIALGFHGLDEGGKMLISGGGHHMQGLAGFGDNNQAAIPLLMVLPILYYLSRQSVNRWVRYACLGTALLDILAVMSTWSRGAFIGLGVLAVALVVLSRRRLRALALVGTVAAIVLSIGSASYFDRIDTIRTAEDDGSFMGRVLAWEVSYAIARENPFFGEGFHGVQDPKIWQRYVYKVDIPEIYRHMELPKAKAAHSIYFEIMGDIGFLGLFLYMMLMFAGFYYSRSIIKVSKRNPQLQWMYDLAVMLRLSLIVYATAGAGVSMAWFEFFYIVLTMISVLARLAREIRAEDLAATRHTAIGSGAFLLDPITRPAVARITHAERPA